MYKLLLSLRYFRSRFLGVASLLAITFGVAMLVIVQSIMGGYLAQTRENIRGQEAHLQVTGVSREFDVEYTFELEEIIENVENVKAFSPFVERLAVYRGLLSFRPCRLEGIDPVGQMEVGGLGRFVLRPSELAAILEEHAAGSDGERNKPDRARVIRAADAVLEDESRESLDASEMEQLFSKSWREKLIRDRHPELIDLLEGNIPPACLVGIQLLLDGDMSIGEIIPVATVSPDSANPQPLERDFVVVGAVKTGDFEEDVGTIYAELTVVRSFLDLLVDPRQGTFRVQGVRVALHEPEKLEETRRALSKALHPLYPHLAVRTWTELKSNLLKAVLIEKFLVYFIVLILVVFTGSMILLMLLLTVIEKTRDIGVLVSLGATPHGVTSIFLLNGLAISVLGTALGFGLGFAFCSRINEIHDLIYDKTGWSLFRAEIYQLDRIPVAFEPLDILLSTIPPVMIGLLASLIPALWAPRRDPIRALQFE